MEAIESTNLEVEDENEEEEPINYKYLSYDALHYLEKVYYKKHSRVPPPTPNYDIDYERQQPPIPQINIETLKEIPQVSNQGIKFTIKKLGQQLGCNQYEYDLIQFWLLDILTDCLWKAQEIFKFDEEQQKVILSWVMAIFRIIADPNLNLSRKQFLKLFKEILFYLYDSIRKSSEFPPVTILNEFIIANQEQPTSSEFPDSNESSESSDSNSNFKKRSTSTLSISSFDLSKGNLKICPEFDIKKHIESLKIHNPLSNLYQQFSDPYLPSPCKSEDLKDEMESADSEHSRSFQINYSPLLQEAKFFKTIDALNACRYNPSKSFCYCLQEVRDEDKHYDDDNLCIANSISNAISKHEEEPNLNSSEVKTESEEVLNYLSKDHGTNVANRSERFASVADRRNPQIDACSGDLKDGTKDEKEIDEETELVDENLLEMEIFKKWSHFKLMEQRNQDMDDSTLGWVPWRSWDDDTSRITHQASEKNSNGSSVKTSLSDAASVSSPDEDFDFLRKLNYNILKAIVDFVFQYFYESFHFELIKYAFRYPPNTMTYTINNEWNVPKVFKEIFKRPKPAKMPKPKAKKEKSKSSKKSDKSKKSNKSQKSKKSSKPKKEKKEKKGKKEKKKPLTNEEKEELQRQKLEAIRMEEEQRKRDENRVFMFPLADAASEELFMQIFENWTKEKTPSNKKSGNRKKK